MEHPRATDPGAQNTTGWARAPMEKSPIRPERRSLGARTGAPWADLPDRYPSFQTCHRRFQQWVRDGVMRRIMQVLAVRLQRGGDVDVREAYIDATFAAAKKGAKGR